MKRNLHLLKAETATFIKSDIDGCKREDVKWSWISKALERVE